LIAAGIALAIITALDRVGSALKTRFGTISTSPKSSRERAATLSR
jgi:Flp pilus assembly pilin Flp